MSQDALQERHITVRYLRDMALLRLDGEEVGLGEMLMYLKTLCRSDAYISEALTSLMVEDRVTQDSAHTLRAA